MAEREPGSGAAEEERSGLLIMEDELPRQGGPRPEERKARAAGPQQPAFSRLRYDPVEVVIPASAQRVAADAFQGRERLRKVRFEEPSQVQEIEAGAFCDCCSLEEVLLPQSGSLKRIGQDAFRRCTALRKIRLPKGLYEIGQDAFAQCTGLESVHCPEGLLRIGPGAFALCPKWMEIRIPASVESIGEDAFYLKEEEKGRRTFLFGERQNFAGIGADTLIRAGRCPRCGKQLPLIGRCGCR